MMKTVLFHSNVIWFTVFFFFALTFASTACAVPPFNFGVFTSDQKLQKQERAVYVASTKVHSKTDFEVFIQTEYVNFFRNFADQHGKVQWRMVRVITSYLSQENEENVSRFEDYLIFLHRTLHRLRREHAFIDSQQRDLVMHAQANLLATWEAVSRERRKKAKVLSRY